jgi:EmrB/QacA subfamily drug resistance transporter
VGATHTEPDAVRLGTPAGRGLLGAAVLGSGMAFLDSTVVNVAVRAIGKDLDASLGALQWTITGYTLTLAALILVSGTLGDRFGRRRLFVIGVTWFAVASLACALVPNVELLVIARLLQGVGGALLTPGSLAMLQASFAKDDRAKAIGLWSGLSGVAVAAGPFVGGWLIELSWRWIFAINLPLAVVTVALALRCAPESRDPNPEPMDVPGAALGILALGAGTYALIAAGGGSSPAMLATTAVLAVGAGAGFVVRQLRSRHPSVPPELFTNRVFNVVNLETLFVYAALSGVAFFLVLQLQTSLGYSPLQAGIATLPMTALLTAFSGWAGAFGARVGPRLPLTAGPLLAAAGLLLLVGVSAGDDYWTAVLPGVLLFGVGLTMLVAPLTATVMAAAPHHLVGTGSGVNNAVARTGGLLAVAALPAVAGLSGHAYEDPVALTSGYRVAMWVCVALLAVGAGVAAVALPGRQPVQDTSPQEEQR